jgi:hypothetical protein
VFFPPFQTTTVQFSHQQENNTPYLLRMCEVGGLLAHPPAMIKEKGITGRNQHGTGGAPHRRGQFFYSLL